MKKVRARLDRKEYDKMTSSLKMHGPNDEQEMIDKLLEITD